MEKKAYFNLLQINNFFYYNASKNFKRIHANFVKPINEGFSTEQVQGQTSNVFLTVEIMQTFEL
jgi:ABC-type enterochelin transport system permease subunit